MNAERFETLSHGQWSELRIADHDARKPFAPENGQPLKFRVGERVIFRNEAGIDWPMTITGLYQPKPITALYAQGRRYLVDSDSPWFPVRECDLRR